MPIAVHITLPGYQVAEAQTRARETVASFLRRVGWNVNALPTICVFNGAPLMRRDWRRRRIRKTDTLEFRSSPRGGSTGSVLGLVGLIALSVLAPWAGGLAATALGFTAAAVGSTAAGLAGSLIGAGILAGGAFLISSFTSPKPADSQQQQSASLVAFSQLSNSARPLGTIPVKYGRVKSTADYAAVPWAEYVGEDQYLNLLLVNGLGKYQREQILIDDTVLWDADTGISSQFSGVEIVPYDPGEEITLFPLNVAASVEVNGQELADVSEWVGGYIANASGMQASALALDFVYPEGLYFVQNNKQAAYLSQIIAQARPVNDAGAPTGDWVEIVNDIRSGASSQPFHASYKVDVTPGRYEVRARRGIAAGFSSTAHDKIQWLQLRSFISGPRSFAGISVTAIRMKATAQLTAASSSKFNTIDTRILPTWNGSAWVDAPTRSPAWAKLDAATNTDYGCRRPLNKVDLQALVDLDATATARGDTFDYEFKDAVPATEALDTILGVMRTKHRWLGDVLSVVRDEWRPLPSMLLTDREIVRGSFSVDYLMQPDDACDAVVVEYLDEDTWQPAEVQCPLDVDALAPMRVQIKGIVQRAQAYREAAFLWKQNAYRRVRPTITTEHDGRLLSFGSSVILQSEIPMTWGSAGDVVSASGTSLVLNPAPQWGEGQNYILFRQATGEPFGPVKASRGATNADCTLDGTDLALVESQQGIVLADVLARVPGSALPSFAIGLGTTWQQRCIVLTGSPSGDNVTLELVVDSEAVHDDSGDPGSVPPAASLNLPKNPLVYGLIASLEQNVLEPVLSVSWFPAAGALSYIAQISYDGRATWFPLAQLSSTAFNVVVQPRALSVRVAAIGAGQGAWTVVDLEAPVIDGDKMLIGPDGVAPGLAYLVTREMVDALNSAKAGQESLAGLLAEVAAHQTLVRLEDVRRVTATFAGQRAEYTFQIGAVADDVFAATTRIETLESESTGLSTSLATLTSTVSTLATQTDAIATEVTDLTATVNDLAASVHVTWAAGVTPTGATAAWDLQLVAGSVSVGISAIALSAGGGQVRLSADKVVFAKPDGTPFALFQASGGDFYLAGSIFATGSILASHLNVSALSAITANIGTVTAGRMLSSDEKVDFNLTDKYLLFKD